MAASPVGVRGRRPPEAAAAGGVAGPLSPHQVEGEPVHEQGLRRRHSHGQVHAQLVPRPTHRDALGRCLRQDLQPQCPYHEHKDGHTAPAQHQVVADLPKEQAHEDPTNHPNILVAQESHQVDSAEVCVDSDKVEAEQDGQHLHCQPGQRRARLQPQEVGREPILGPQRQASHQDVGDESHGWNVEVRSVDVKAGGHRRVLLVLHLPVLV